MTTPTVKTTHVPTITPTVTGRFFDDVMESDSAVAVPFPK